MSQDRWGRSHSAYISESVQIHYRWSNLFGVSLPVLRRMHCPDGDRVICESPQGNAVALPVWMTDQNACAAFSAGTAVVSLSALRDLRNLLDTLHSTSHCDKPSGSIPLEDPDEATKDIESDAGRAVRRAGPKRRSKPTRTARGSKSGTRSNSGGTVVKGGRQNRKRRKRP